MTGKSQHPELGQEEPQGLRVNPELSCRGTVEHQIREGKCVLGKKSWRKG